VVEARAVAARAAEVRPDRLTVPSDTTVSRARGDFLADNAFLSTSVDPGHDRDPQ
jgi:hypothetical protein